MRKSLKSIWLGLLVIGCALLIHSPLATAAFNPNRVIDDVIFDNATAMSAGEIDVFLNSRSQSCISTNSGFASKIPSGYSPSGGFTYGGFGSAGQVIATASQVYGINPKVLLVTLEKEQSLVTGRDNFASYCNNGDEHKYASAAGYGCLDGGAVYNWSGVSLYRRGGVEHTTTGSTCVNSSIKAGFSQQVIRAAWLLKFGQQRSLGNIDWAVISGSWDNSDDPQSCYSGPITEGYRQTCPSGPSVYYDGLKTIDGAPVHMDTGATAALYWYTPHFHGNQVFVSLFEGWFGPTQGDPFSWNVVETHIYDAGKNVEISPAHLRPGDRVLVSLKVRNSGTEIWYRDGPNPIRLGTDRSLNHSSLYCDDSWLSCNRVAKLREVALTPGQEGHFEFYFTAPRFTTGEFREYFRPLLENRSWMTNDIGFHIYTKTSSTLSWGWAGVDAWTDSSKSVSVNLADLSRDQQVFVTVKAYNSSASIWYNAGSYPMTLGTSNPLDHNASICTASWIKCSRPSLMSEAGTYPGQVASFSFTAKAPGQLGEYREYFKPLAEGNSWGSDNPNHIYFNVVR